MEPHITLITLGVKDLERSYHFYHKGLGFATGGKPEDGMVMFQTNGTRLSLYPLDKLGEDISPDIPAGRDCFPGITLSHNTRTKDEVDTILEMAEKAGGRIIKSAQPVFWGGYHGYFSDPDGYYWEVAWADFWQFNADGSLII